MPKTRNRPELIDQLITKPDIKDNRENPVQPSDVETPNGFAENFSLLLRETPNIGSTSRSEFWAHSVLGGALMLPLNVRLKNRLSVKDIYVKYTPSQSESGKYIIRLCFLTENRNGKQVFLRTFVNDRNVSNQNYNRNELREIKEKLGDNVAVVNEYVFGIYTDENDKLFKLSIKEQESTRITFESIRSGSSQTDEFKSVVGVERGDLNNMLDYLSSSKTREVKFGIDSICNRISQVYDKLEKPLSLDHSEAAYHGFNYGALVLNFKYYHSLNCYVERVAGRGRADLVIISRKNRRTGQQPIPVVIEFKSGSHSPSDAIRQIEERGYLYNLAVRTKAKEALVLGVNSSTEEKKYTSKEEDIFQSKGFINQLLNAIIETNDDTEREHLIKAELKNLYYSMHNADEGYLGKLMLGQILAASDLSDKQIFSYVDDKIERKVTTFKLTKNNQKIILNIIIPDLDAGTKSRPRYETFDSNKTPLDGEAVKVDITVEPRAETFEGGYCKDIKISEFHGSANKYQGRFKDIGNIDISNLIQDLRDGHMPTLEEALFPFKEIINRELYLQATMQGLFMNRPTIDGKDIGVYTEINVSSGGKIDLALTFTELKSDRYGNAQIVEDDPIIVELKHVSNSNNVSNKLKEAVEQLQKYKILRSFTDQNSADFLAMVFDQSSVSQNKLIKADIKTYLVYHTSESGTSSSSPKRSPAKKRPGSPLAECSKRRRVRNVGVLCIDSRDEESIEEKERKEEIMEELFNTDKMRERAKNIEFYDQLFKLSQQISQGEIMDKSVEKAFVAKMKDIDLNSIDPEIRDIVKEMKNSVENKEEIENILRRSRVAGKIGKVAEGAGLAFTMFLVGRHVVNGDIEGLGYDALNLWVMPKIGEKISGKMLGLGTKLDSQMLKGFAPVMGRAIGNFAAFLGLAESIKARQSATDPVDIKIADLNIATNSIFIAADVPAVVTEAMSAVGMEAGIIGEFAGPVGAAVSVAVIIISQFVEAGLEVEKLEEHINLTDQEKHDFYWDFFLGKKVPDYIKDDIEAEQIYKQYVSNIVSRFKDQYSIITMSLPKIFITKEDYVYNMARDVGCILKGGSRDKPNELDFRLSTNVELFNITSTDHYSRVVLNNVRDYNIFCGPLDSDIRAQFVNSTGVLFHPYKLRDGCYQIPHDGVVKRTLEQWLLQEYPYQCKNAVVYKSRDSNKHKSIYYILSQNANIRPYANYNATVIFYGRNISILSDRNKDVGSKIENRYYFEKPLENCNVHKSGSNFFYVVEDKLLCNLGTGKQKNIVVIRNNFTDSENIHSIIGSHGTDRIEVSHASYVNGQGGKDVITAKNFTTIKGYFGDSIYGKGLVLLPINFDHISKITCADNRVIVHNQNGQVINVDKQSLIKTADEGIDIFVTPIKVEDSTKKVTDLHIVAKVKNETITECESSFFISAITEDVIAGELKSVGSAFLKRFFNEPYRDSANCLIIDSVLIIFISALKGWLLNHPNFRVTKQLFGRNYDVTYCNCY